jgi:transketolase
MAATRGISYLRTSRGAYQVLYLGGETSPIGGSKVLHFTGKHDVTLIGAGVTPARLPQGRPHSSQEGIRARVIDCYSIKPLIPLPSRRPPPPTGLS